MARLDGFMMLDLIQNGAIFEHTLPHGSRHYWHIAPTEGERFLVHPSDEHFINEAIWHGYIDKISDRRFGSSSVEKWGKL